jgi:heme/copper-type cytochrome/quinol oxidase subunit 1
MKRLLLRDPDCLFLLMGAFVFALGAISNLFQLGSIDFHLHDTMFVVSTGLVWMGVALYLGTVGLIYLAMRAWMKYPLIRRLGLIHFWVTFGSVLLIAITTRMPGSKPHYPDVSNWHTFEHYQYYDVTIAWVALLVMFCQILPVVILIYGWLRSWEPNGD